jgi:hypothetical protein
MSDNGDFGMGCEGENSITKYPTSAIDNPKVFSIDPFSRFVMVTTLTPSRYTLPN